MGIPGQESGSGQSINYPAGSCEIREVDLEPGGCRPFTGNHHQLQILQRQGDRGSPNHLGVGWSLLRLKLCQRFPSIPASFAEKRKRQQVSAEYNSGAELCALSLGKPAEVVRPGTLACAPNMAENVAAQAR